MRSCTLMNGKNKDCSTRECWRYVEDMECMQEADYRITGRAHHKDRRLKIKLLSRSQLKKENRVVRFGLIESVNSIENWNTSMNVIYLIVSIKCHEDLQTYTLDSQASCVENPKEKKREIGQGD
ncbi:hypothetical protein L1987_01993 [Smallanthus sonchifolius]|uniref:Uncharacterized protein n=1 Tax=Smallanthus sonchifolius TaxID=185202 RepID=A0ACB9K6M6_9ASTR|nr:hypothetical protein L1987_01993 [Smallanthus sonchifolius]